MGSTQQRLNIHTGTRETWIEISIRYDLPESEYIDTLVHEMIHYYILTNDITDDAPHGTIFNREMKRINELYGIKVTLCFEHSEEELIATASRDRFVCVAGMDDGTFGVAVVAKNNVLAFWDEFYKIPGVRDVKWFISNREIFRLFPQKPRAALYIIENETISRYLTGARRIIREGYNIRYDSM